mmetsp:Transcript_43583/g.52257  ORF Transcript_43583/g.52257 Transcript_43583/m.52257 type:complete len:170 (-) Transcript_43583:425-934(-)
MFHSPTVFALLFLSYQTTINNSRLGLVDATFLQPLTQTIKSPRPALLLPTAFTLSCGRPISPFTSENNSRKNVAARRRRTARRKIAISAVDKNKSNVEVQNQSQNEEKSVVQVGSKEYYSGFVNRGFNEEPVERVSGDALLFPILKFAGLCALFIGAALIAFLSSNNLL